MNYEFQYTVVRVTANFEAGKLRVKQGLRTFELNVSEIEQFYAGKMPPGDAMELVINTRNSAGKTKRFRFYSNEGEAGFDALIAEISRQRPSADLSALSRAEAFAKMKAADTAKAAFWAVPVIVLAAMGILTSPLLIHGLDRGHAVVSVADLKNGNLQETRNLTVQGMALNQGLQETTTRKGKKTVRMFFPLVAPDHREGEPVFLLVETGDLSDSELNEILARDSFEGVLRNVLWEGPSSKQLNFFRDEYKMPLAEKVYLLELGGSKNDLFAYLAIMGISAIVLAGVMIYMKKKMM